MLRGRKPAPLRVVGPDDGPCPTPPSFLSAYACEEWADLAPYLYSEGRLTMADRGAFSAYCDAYGLWRRAKEEAQNDGLTIETKSGNIIQNPKVGIANAARRDMVRAASEFGLTPSARARFASKGGKKDRIASKYFDDDDRG